MKPHDLDIHIDDLTQVQFRHGNNSAYFKGFADEPTLSGRAKIWMYIGYVLVIASPLLAIPFTAIVVFITVFNSSLAIQTEGVVDGYAMRGSPIIQYHYEVDGVRYEKEETSNHNLTKSSWRDGDTPEPVYYLSFMPSVSRLEHNVEDLDLLTIGFGYFFLIVLFVVGAILIRDFRKSNKLLNSATHVIEGVIVSTMIGQKKLKMITYEAYSPLSGESIRGGSSVGLLEPTYQNMTRGTPVAILYASDDLHAIL